MERKVVFSAGEYYHLYNRGVERRNIFLSKTDYDRFIALLYCANSKRPLHLSEFLKTKKRDAVFFTERQETLVDIGAYCLMPNHFHILAREKTNQGISTFMLKLATAYSMYFNKKYRRNGRLFQGTFRSTHATEDTYLQYLFCYIHLNPVKLKDVSWKKNNKEELDELYSFISAYPFSSFREYLGHERPEKYILNSNAFPTYFNQQHTFSDFIKEWIDIKTDFQG